MGEKRRKSDADGATPSKKKKHRADKAAATPEAARPAKETAKDVPAVPVASVLSPIASRMFLHGAPIRRLHWPVAPRTRGFLPFRFCVVWSGLVLEGCVHVFGLGLRSLPQRLSLTRVNGRAPCVRSLLGWLVFARAALAGKKLTKRLYKLIAASAKGRTLRRGLKEVVKAVRKNQTGYVGRLAVELMWADGHVLVPFPLGRTARGIGHAGCRGSPRPSSAI